MYKVYFVSRENHTYTYSCKAKSEMEAISMGEAQILANGWTQYEYCFDEIVKG